MKPFGPVASIAEGACARARRMLDSYLDGELTVETTHEMLEHIERCLACKGETSAREALKAALRRVVLAGDGTPDAALAARIRAEVARTRPRTGLGGPVALLAAAVAVAAGLAVARHRPPVDGRGGIRAAHLAAVTQVHCALGFPWPEAPPELASLARHADALAPVLPGLSASLPAGWGIVAAHRCLEEGQPVLHVILRRAGQTGPSSLASLVIVPGAGAGAVAGSSLAPAPNDKFAIVSQPGKNATDFVVTSGSHEEAMDLARQTLPLLKPISA